MELFTAVKRHHEYVAERGYRCVMTVLIGSQNYGLSNENSDIDTFTFILPSFEDMAFVREPKSGEFEVEDGKCMYKDIRLALNLLKKTSPNSVECVVGQYRYFEPEYFEILEKYLCNENYMNDMIHCNYSHMLYAMAGMARQLTKRNMPSGKRYSHALRLLDMVKIFQEHNSSRRLLQLSAHLDEARLAKRDTDTNKDDMYNVGCFLIAELLDTIRDNFQLTDEKRQIEKRGMQLIEQLQKELFQKYIENEVINGD